MPLKLIDPRPGKTPFYYIRGTYLGVYVDETAGTPSKALAQQFLKQKREAIERGELTIRAKVAKEIPTFASVALSYIEAGGESRFLGVFDPDTGQWKSGLIPYFGETPLTDIDQEAIDKAARELFPNRSQATRNRQVHTPASAVLKHGGIDRSVRRPKGGQGKKRTDWRQPEQVFRLLAAATKVKPEFGIFVTFLAYTGCRLSDALDLTCDRLLLSEAFAYLDETKNDDPRGVYLPPFLVAALANHPRGLDRGMAKVFRFRKNGHLYNMLKKAKKAAGPDLATTTFHTLSHTWATWMRRYGGLDTRGLVGTGRWKDQKSASRYEHVVASEESQRADFLPTPEQSSTEVHGFSTDSAAGLRLRSPKNAG
jgi:integrase